MSVTDGTAMTPGEHAAACTDLAAWAAFCHEHGYLTEIVQARQKAETLRCIAVGDNLGRDAELRAMEASRRVERTLARAIRDGQNDGTIRRQGKVQTDLPSPNEFAQDLAGHSGQPGLYALADGVTDAEFDTAIRLAYEDRNLSRANVFRKIVRQRIGEEPDMSKSDRPEVLRGTRRLDHNRMANELAITLEGAAQVARLIESSALDADSIEGWVASLSDSLRSLNRFHRQLKETTRAQGT